MNWRNFLDPTGQKIGIFGENFPDPQVTNLTQPEKHKNCLTWPWSKNFCAQIWITVAVWHDIRMEIWGSGVQTLAAPDNLWPRVAKNNKWFPAKNSGPLMNKNLQAHIFKNVNGRDWLMSSQLYVSMAAQFWLKYPQEELNFWRKWENNLKIEPSYKFIECRKRLDTTWPYSTQALEKGPNMAWSKNFWPGLVVLKTASLFVISMICN